MAKINTFKFYFLLTFLTATLALNAQDTWLQKSSYPGGNREGACGFSIGTTGYFMTGLNIDTDHTDMWAWNQISDTWTQMAPFTGGKRLGANAVSLNGYGYLTGGVKPSNCFRTMGGSCGGIYYYDFWRYSPDSNTWTKIDSFPGVGRDYGVMVADPQNSCIYYGTGNDNLSAYLYDWWVYNTITATWTQLTSFPGGQRANAVGFYANGYIYVGTGDNYNNHTDATNDMWRYNVTNDTWQQVASVPGTLRRQATAFSIGIYGFVCLGAVEDSVIVNNVTNYTTAYMNDMWMYNSVADTWTQVASYPQGAGYFASGFSIGDKGYVGLGTLGYNDTNTFWEYTPFNYVNGLSSIRNNATINVYPNPSSGAFIISNYQLGISNHIEVYNTLGEKVYSQELSIPIAIGTNSQFSIDLSLQPSGVYFYKLQGTDNTFSAGKLLIVK